MLVRIVIKPHKTQRSCEMCMGVIDVMFVLDVHYETVISARF
jgi:hypothetical protein